MEIYKVSCEFYIKAEDKEQVLEQIASEGIDFIESHIIIDNVGVNGMPDEHELWKDFSKEE